QKAVELGNLSRQILVHNTKQWYSKLCELMADRGQASGLLQGKHWSVAATSSDTRAGNSIKGI
ncbi:MAG: hypothetical protein AAF501_08890, partial [Pseudomonadota bacterium]